MKIPSQQQPQNISSAEKSSGQPVSSVHCCSTIVAELQVLEKLPASSSMKPRWSRCPARGQEFGVHDVGLFLEEPPRAGRRPGETLAVISFVSSPTRLSSIMDAGGSHNSRPGSAAQEERPRPATAARCRSTSCVFFAEESAPCRQRAATSFLGSDRAGFRPLRWPPTPALVGRGPQVRRAEHVGRSGKGIDRGYLHEDVEGSTATCPVLSASARSALRRWFPPGRGRGARAPFFIRVARRSTLIAPRQHLVGKGGGLSGPVA